MGRPRKRRREGDEIEAAAFNSLEELHTFDVEGTGLSPTSLLGFDHSVHFPEDVALDFDSTYTAVHSSLATESDDQSLQPRARYPSTPPSHSAIQLAPCACLSEMYLTLSSLQAQTVFSFPHVLPTLRSALATTTNVLKCEECPKQVTTAMQNVMLLTTLLTSITDSYQNLISAIEAEAKQVKESGETKGFRMGDNAPERMHMHTGTPDCPMGFDIELDGDEWRKLARKVVKADVEGSRSGTSSILGLADMLTERQSRWHLDPVMEGARRCTMTPKCVPQDGEFSCLKMVDMIRRHVAGLGL
jgi:hypothetical protein